MEKAGRNSSAFLELHSLGFELRALALGQFGISLANRKGAIFADDAPPGDVVVGLSKNSPAHIARNRRLTARAQSTVGKDPAARNLSGALKNLLAQALTFFAGFVYFHTFHGTSPRFHDSFSSTYSR